MCCSWAKPMALPPFEMLSHPVWWNTQRPQQWSFPSMSIKSIAMLRLSNDSLYFQDDKDHCLHLNLNTFRIWCYKCEAEMFPLNNEPRISSSLLNLFSKEINSPEPQSRFETQHGRFSSPFLCSNNWNKLFLIHRSCWTSEPRQYMLFECCPSSLIQCHSYDPILPGVLIR